MKKAVVILFLFLLLAVQPMIFAQDATSCSGTAKYCVGNNVFECVDSTPTMLERCNGDCKEGKCIDIPIEPNVTTVQEPRPEPVSSSDMIFYICLGIVGLVILYLLIKTFKDR